MEVGASWKSALEDEEDMDKINSAADATLMQVKGKKLTLEREAMSKVWLQSLTSLTGLTVNGVCVCVSGLRFTLMTL